MKNHNLCKRLLIIKNKKISEIKNLMAFNCDLEETHSLSNTVVVQIYNVTNVIVVLNKIKLLTSAFYKPNCQHSAFYWCCDCQYVTSNFQFFF